MGRWSVGVTNVLKDVAGVLKDTYVRVSRGAEKRYGPSFADVFDCNFAQSEGVEVT